MYKIAEAIVVEGRYDKNTLSQIVDAAIIETSGFGVFNDREKQKLIRRLAEKRGLIVFTDSDGAGFVIRSFIKSCVPPQYLKHAYIPDIEGKEKRKSKASKEGKLGVEGMSPEIIINALRRAGATIEGEDTPQTARISKADMYAKGLSGKPDSSQKRRELMKKLELPEKMSADALLQVLNVLMTREDFLNL
ncbi:MAG: DUF4093 domain-containing protein [Ruminiclostridium sp.]|nr:DUF4093 domain-containing protein [Ruminiclostridium sp.]MCF0136771.1 DUF4093 domain-containing protein [Oscillospiraceae bacterium]